MVRKILSIDIGTTRIKSGIITDQGEVVATAKITLPDPPAGRADRSEVDPAIWGDGLNELMTRLQTGTPCSPDAICISGNGPTLVVADRGGTPLAPAITWKDRRAVLESTEIQKCTGVYLDPSFFLPKLLWIQKNHPEVARRIGVVLDCPGYILYKATGCGVNISTGPLLSKYIWTEEMIDALELPVDWFPPTVPPGTIVGSLLKSTAEAWNLPPGIPVVAGGSDFILTLLGTATVTPGDICYRSGTSDGINLCTTTPTSDLRLMSFEHIISGLYNTSGIVSNTGGAIDWFRKKILPSGTTFSDVVSRTERVPPGSDGLIFLPYLSGERAPVWDPDARGAFIGLNTLHTADHMLRGVVESAGFSVREVLDVLECDENEPLRLTGDPSEKDYWNQIKADILGRAIMVPRIQDAELLGGAILSITALGGRTLTALATELVEFSRTYYPSPSSKQVYDDLYGIYLGCYQQLKDKFHLLAKFQTRGG